MHTLYLHGLKVHTTLGAYAYEQVLQQTLVLDVELTGDFSEAAKHDDLSAALDYAVVVQGIRQQLQTQHFKLIEAAAEHLAQWLLTHHDALRKVKIKLSKGGVLPDVRDTGIMIERERSTTPLRYKKPGCGHNH